MLSPPAAESKKAVLKYRVIIFKLILLYSRN